MKKTFKKIIIALFAVILCLSAISCGDKDDFVPAGYKRASDKNADHTLYVPEGWVVDNSTGVTMARVSKSDSSNISFMSFELDEKKISTEENKDKELIDKFWDYYKAELKKTFPDMKVDAENDGVNMLVSKKSAKKYVYTATVTGAEYKFMQIVVIKGKTVYLLTYTAKVELFNEHLSTVNKIAGYIEIK